MSVFLRGPCTGGRLERADNRVDRVGRYRPDIDKIAAALAWAIFVFGIRKCSFRRVAAAVASAPVSFAWA
jgi:hypothetical protein